MKNYAKSGIRKGKTAYRTPSRLRVSLDNNFVTIKVLYSSNKKYATKSN